MVRGQGFWLVVLGVVLGVLPGSAGAQLLPDTLWVRVIFYDFHPDGSNPEFEVAHHGDLMTGMVQPNRLSYSRENAAYFNDRFTVVGRPLVGQNPFFNHYINKWYQSWKPGDYTIPRYTDLQGGYAGPKQVDYDTAFVNKTIFDSLPFLNRADMGPGVYQFSRAGSESGEEGFFWLDSNALAFGNEPAGLRHNYSFTMELHHEFIYQPGLTFSFNGDDDVWVFVNDSLVLDLGGMHNSAFGTFNLDNVEGLQIGGRYRLDLFYAERRTTRSTIRITTNIFSPARLVLQPLLDTVTAGAISVVARARVFDSEGAEQDSLARLVQWRIVPGDSAGGDSLQQRQGQQLALRATQAHRTLRLEARYFDQLLGNWLTQRMAVVVRPGPAARLWIEACDGDVGSLPLNQVRELDTLFVPRGQAQGRLYAVSRDAFDNLIGPAPQVYWRSSVPARVWVRSEPAASWVGEVGRELDSAALEQVVGVGASWSGLLGDTVVVVVGDYFKLSPPSITPHASVLGGVYRYGEELAITISQPQQASVRYCIDCDQGKWLNYQPTQGVVLSRPDTVVVRAYAWGEGEGVVWSDTVVERYVRVGVVLAPPRAIPGDTVYRGSVQVRLESSSGDRGESIFYFVGSASRTPPPRGDFSAQGWQRYGSELLISDSLPVVLFGYSAVAAGDTSEVARWRYTNSDWNGPMLRQALFYLGNPPGFPPSSRPDTLLLILDEPAQLRDLEKLEGLFTFIDVNGDASGGSLFYRARLEQQPTGPFTTVRLLLDAEESLPLSPLLDSIAARKNAFTDVQGNVTASQKAVVVGWGRSYGMVVEVAKNPVTFTTPVPPALYSQLLDRQGLGAQGATVRITAADEIDVQGASLAIYDAVGNVVCGDVQLRRVRASRQVVVVWDLRNRQGRMVGSGTYLLYGKVLIRNGTICKRVSAPIGVLR